MIIIMLRCYIIYTLVISAITFLLFSIDKLMSKKENRPRIPEETLLCFSALGGSVGALLGIYLVRHKSNFRTKFHFAMGAWFAFAVQASIAVLIALSGGGYIGV